VVDNEKVDRDMLQNVLDPLGFQVEQAASGFECLLSCRASRRT
jgi:CheY-like chemotaxis protein